MLNHWIQRRFVAPTYETFETVQSARRLSALQNFREPDLESRLGVYTLFDEELVEALLTSDFRDGLDAISLDTDANLTADRSTIGISWFVNPPAQPHNGKTFSSGLTMTLTVPA